MKSKVSAILKSSLFTAGLLGSAMSVADSGIGAAVFNKNGELKLPQGYRQWVFIGAPLTPHGLNGGKAGFPEYHHVYVNPDAFDVYKRTGTFPEGAVIAKELVLVKKGKHEDGSYDAPSGRGYFADKYNGMDVMVKDNKRFSKTNGWGFFNFGHHSPPYMTHARSAPKNNCASCHAANAKKDMVFTQFYPILK